MKHIVKYFILIFLLLPSNTFADSSKKDSILLQNIEKSKGEKKLELMFEYANRHIASADKIINIANSIKQEALTQKNMRYVAGSYAIMSRHFMNQNNLDSTIYYANLSNYTYSEYNINNPGQTYQYMAIAYMNKGYYELAIHSLDLYIKTHKEDIQAYIMLGTAYIHTDKFDLSKKYLIKALDMFKSDKALEELDITTIYIGLAYLSNEMEDYQSALHYSTINEAILDSIATIDYNSNIEMRYSIMYTLYAMAHFGAKNAKEGKIYLDKAIALPFSQNNSTAKLDINNAIFEYYFLLKKYDKASSYLEEVLKSAKNEFAHTTIFIKILNRKVSLLEVQGKYKEALSIQKELTNNKDSVYQRNIPLQISELSKAYELDKAKIEKEKDKAKLQKSQIIIIGFAIVTILLCLILYIVKHNATKLKAKNKALYKQRAEVDAYIKLTKSSLLAQNTEEESSSKEKNLFNKFEKYIKEEEIFRNSALDREEIALALGTNRQYLADAVKAETGKTFMDYINDYRLDYARYQLITDTTIPIASVIHDSGFSSNTTFYRLFKERFGMTPNELRKVKDELEKEIINGSNIG